LAKVLSQYIESEPRKLACSVPEVPDAGHVSRRPVEALYGCVKPAACNFSLSLPVSSIGHRENAARGTVTTSSDTELMREVRGGHTADMVAQMTNLLVTFGGLSADISHIRWASLGTRVAGSPAEE